MGAFISRKKCKEDKFSCIGEDVLIPEQGCPWATIVTSEERACFKQLFPMFDENEDLKKDTAPKPSLLQRLGFWKIWPIMLALLIIDFVLVEIQNRVPALKPFNSAPLDFIFVGSGFFVFGVITSSVSRSRAASDAAHAFWNANTSFAQHLATNIRSSMMNSFDMMLDIHRYDPYTCEVTLVQITAFEILREIYHILKANPYALTNDNRKKGLIIGKLPLPHTLKNETAYNVSVRNPSHMESLGTMLEIRAGLLVENGFMIDNTGTAIRAQVDGMNNGLGAVAVTKIRSSKHINFFLGILQFVWSVFLVWRLDTYNRFVAVAIAFAIQYAFYALPALARAGANPFENLEVNPLSPIPLQDLQHSAALQPLMMIMVLMVRIKTYTTPPRTISKKLRSKTTHATLDNDGAWAEITRLNGAYGGENY